MDLVRKLHVFFLWFVQDQKQSGKMRSTPRRVKIVCCTPSSAFFVESAAMLSIRLVISEHTKVNIACIQFF